MGCNCGQRRQTNGETAPVSTMSQNRRRAIYVVTEPDGSVHEFDDHQAAAIHRRATSGVLTTSTA